EQVRLENELERLLAEIVSICGRIGEIDDRELLVRAGAVAFAAEWTVHADAREAGPRELACGPRAGNDGGPSYVRFDASIDERTISTRARAHEERDGKARRRHRRSRNGDDDVRGLSTLQSEAAA